MAGSLLLLSKWEIKTHHRTKFGLVDCWAAHTLFWALRLGLSFPVLSEVMKPKLYGQKWTRRTEELRGHMWPQGRTVGTEGMLQHWSAETTASQPVRVHFHQTATRVGNATSRIKKGWGNSDRMVHIYLYYIYIFIYTSLERTRKALGT